MPGLLDNLTAVANEPDRAPTQASLAANLLTVANEPAGDTMTPAPAPSMLAGVAKGIANIPREAGSQLTYGLSSLGGLAGLTDEQTQEDVQRTRDVERRGTAMNVGGSSAGMKWAEGGGMVAPMLIPGVGVPLSAAQMAGAGYGEALTEGATQGQARVSGVAMGITAALLPGMGRAIAPVIAPLTRVAAKAALPLGATGARTVGRLAEGALHGEATNLAFTGTGAATTAQYDTDLAREKLVAGVTDPTLALLGAAHAGGTAALRGVARAPRAAAAQLELAGNQPEMNMPREGRGAVAQQAVDQRIAQQAEAVQQADAAKTQALQSEIGAGYDDAQRAANPPVEAGVETTPQERVAQQAAGYQAQRIDADNQATARAQAEVEAGDALREERMAQRLRASQEEQALHARVDARTQVAADTAEAERAANPPVEAEPGGPETDAQIARRQAGMEGRQIQLRAQAEPTPPPTGAVESDPAVQRAKANFDRIAADPAAPREAKRYAREGLAAAVAEARQRMAEAPIEHAPMETAGSEPAEFPGEPVAERDTRPRLQPPTIAERFRAGEITGPEAVQLKRQERLANARPPSIQETRQGQDSRPSAQRPAPEADAQRGRNAGNPEGGVERVPGVREDRGRAQEIEGQDQSGRAQEPVLRPGDEIPEPVDREVAEAAEGTLPATQVHPDVQAVQPSAATAVAERQAAGDGKRVVRSAGGAVVSRVKAAVQNLGRVFGAFKGNKEKAMPMMVAATEKTMSPAERTRVTHTEDLFGGSGSAGLLHRVLSFPSAGTHVIREWNEARLEKIRMVQTMEPEAVRGRAKALGVEKAVREAIEGGASGGGVTGRLESLIERWIDPNTGKLKNPADKERAALVQLYVDSVNRAGTQGGKVKANDIWSTIINGLYGKDGYVAAANKLARTAKAKGVDIQYKQGDSFAADVPRGDHVHVLADPPYFGTSGYNGQTTVGAGTYARVGKMLERLKANGNHVQYTDEAWWTRKKPTSADWKDGTQLQRGDETLRQIHDTATTFDTHRVGNRTESLATIHPHAPEGERLPGGSTPRPVAERGSQAEPRQEPGREAASTAEAPPVTPSRTEVAPELRERTSAVQAALDDGRSGMAGATAKAREDGSIAVIAPDGKTEVARIYAQAPLKPENVDPRSWWASASKSDGFQSAMRRALGPKKPLPENVNQMLALEPADKFKLFKAIPVGGGFDTRTGDITLRVRPGESVERIRSVASEEIEHSLIHRMPDADKVTLLAGLKARRRVGADASANPADGSRYVDFLEAVRKLNLEYSPKWDAAQRAGRKFGAEQGFGAAMRRVWARIKGFFGVASKAAAQAPDGITVVMPKLRAGEYANSPKRSQGGGDAYATYEDDAGARKGLGVLSDKALPATRAFFEKLNAEAQTRRVSDQELTTRAEGTVRTEYGGDAIKAGEAIVRQGARTAEDHRILEMGINAAAERGDWSATALAKQTKMLMERELGASDAARILRFRQSAGDPVSRLADAQALMFGPSATARRRLLKLRETIRSDAADTGVKSAAQAEYDRLVQAHVQRGERIARTISSKYGIDLRTPGAEAYFTGENAGMVNDIVMHETKANLVDKIGSFYRAALLSDLLRTQTQQITSNFAAAVYHANPLKVALEAKLSGGHAGEGLAALRAALSGRVWLDGLSNARDSFTGRTASEREAGKAWGAPENIDVRERMRLHLGNAERGGADTHSGVVSGVMSFLSARPMAAIDGMAQRMNARVLEARLAYRKARTAGSSHADGMDVARDVLTGEAQVPHDMAVEALMQSLPATFQEFAIPSKVGNPERVGTMDFLRLGQRLTDRLDHAIPLTKATETGEQLHLPIGTIAAPFVRTGLAITRQVIRLTPPAQLAAMGLGKATGKYRGPDGRAEQARDMTHLIMGSLATAALAAGIKAGAVSFVGTEQDPERKRLRAAGKLQGEYTLKAMGVTVPFSRVEPFASAAAAMGNAINDLVDGKGIVKAGKDAGAALLRVGQGLAWFNAVDKVRTVMESSPYADDPSATDKAVQYVADTTGGFIPAIVKNYTYSQDKAVDRPDAYGIASDRDALVSYLKEANGVSRRHERADYAGQPIERAHSGVAGRLEAGGLGKNIKQTGDEFTSALDKFRQSLPEGAPEVKLPGWNRGFNFHSTKYRMTPDEFEQFQKDAGELQAQMVQPLAGAFESLPNDEVGARIANQLISRAHAKAVKITEARLLADRGQPVEEAAPEPAAPDEP